jgi:hypothetical protein
MFSLKNGWNHKVYLAQMCHEPWHEPWSVYDKNCLFVCLFVCCQFLNEYETKIMTKSRVTSNFFKWHAEGYKLQWIHYNLFKCI